MRSLYLQHEFLRDIGEVFLLGLKLVGGLCCTVWPFRPVLCSRSCNSGSDLRKSEFRPEAFRARFDHSSRRFPIGGPLPLF